MSETNPTTNNPTTDTVTEITTQELVMPFTPDDAVELVSKANELIDSKVKAGVDAEKARLQEIIDGQLSITKQEAEMQVKEIQRDAEAKLEAAKTNYNVQVKAMMVEHNNALEKARQDAIRNEASTLEARNAQHKSEIHSLEESRDRYKQKVEDGKARITELERALLAKQTQATLCDMEQMLKEVRKMPTGWQKDRKAAVIDAMLEDLRSVVKPLVNNG